MLAIDFNSDGNVNFKDFSHLAGYWGTNESSVDIAPTPFGDGTVDNADEAALVEKLS